MARKPKFDQKRPHKHTPKGTRPHDGPTRQPKPGRGRPAKGWPQGDSAATDSPTVA